MAGIRDSTSVSALASWPMDRVTPMRADELHTLRARLAAAEAAAGGGGQDAGIEVALPWRCIEFGGARMLAEMVQRHPAVIVTLNLSCNNIGDAGAMALASALCAPGCAVCQLQLDQNNVGDDGALELVRPI